MNLTSIFVNAADAAQDWLAQGSPLWSGAKLTAAVTLAVGALLSPIAAVGYSNYSAMQDRLAALDTRPTHVFASVADCAAKGYAPAACEASQAEANGIARSIGTTNDYLFTDNCLAAHGACETITGFHAPATHRPPVTGWQAAQDDLSQSLPLYRGAEPGTFVRWDGRVFNSAPEPVKP